AAALEADLQRFVRNEPILARPVGPIERAWRWTQRRPTAAALVITAVALIVLSVGGGGWMWRQQTEREAELRTQVDTGIAQAVSLREQFHFDEAHALLKQ